MFQRKHKLAGLTFTVPHLTLCNTLAEPNSHAICTLEVPTPKHSRKTLSFAGEAGSSEVSYWGSLTEESSQHE